MPTKLDLKKDKKKQAPIGGQQLTSGASGSIGGGQSQAPVASGSGRQGTSSGSFTNLSKYLNANKQGAMKNASGIAGKFGSQADKQSEDLNKAADTTLGNIKNNTIQAGDKFINTLKKNPGGLSDDQIKKGQSFYNAKYKGPSEFKYNPGDINETANLISGTETQKGRKTALNRVFGEDGRYTSGLQSFDNLLLQRDAGARNKLNELRDKYKDLGNLFQNRATDVTKAAQHAQDVTNQSRNQIRNLIGQQQHNIETGLDKELKARNKSRRADYNWTKNALAGGTKVGDRNIREADFMQYGGDLNRGDIVTANDMAKIKALQQIAGQDWGIRRSNRDTPKTVDFNEANYKAAVEAARKAANRKPEPAPVEPQSNPQSNWINRRAIGSPETPITGPLADRAINSTHAGREASKQVNRAKKKLNKYNPF